MTNTKRQILRRQAGWWMAFFGLSPLLWLQGRYARWRTPRLSPPAEPLHGLIGEGAEPFSLVVLGESPAAGIGVTTREESLPAQLALQLAQRQGRAVRWRSVAVNGATLGDVIQQQLPQIHGLPIDLIVVVIGVNDTTGLTSRMRWRRHIRELVTGIRDITPAPILFASLPPMESFTAMPQPLRTVMGIRARLLDHDLRETIKPHEGVICAQALPPLTAQQLAADGYHPSPQACQDWAMQLAQVAEAALDHGQGRA